MPAHKYPYTNTDLDSLKNEIWEDIPGLDGYFVVSNFGRVKRCTYETQYKNGAIYIIPEMIIKPTLTKSVNKFIGDKTPFLTTKVTLSGRRYSFTLARLVYYCFVQPFDWDNYHIVIVSVDGDNLNIRPDNLRAVTLSQRSQRTIDRKRYHSPFHDLTASVRAETRKKIVRAKQKQVSQYSATGKRMRTYASMVDAQQATGINAVGIAAVAHGKKIRAGGYFWRWGKESRIDVQAFLAARQKENRQRHGQKVTQYTLTGNRIARYPSVEDAHEETGTSMNAIRLVMRGIYKSARGYYWKKGYGPEKIDLSGYKWGRESTSATQSKRIAQYSLSGKYIRTYDSVKAAAAAVKVGEATMSAASRGLQHTCRGWRWKVV